MSRTRTSVPLGKVTHPAVQVAGLSRSAASSLPSDISLVGAAHRHERHGCELARPGVPVSQAVGPSSLAAVHACCRGEGGPRSLWLCPPGPALTLWLVTEAGGKRSVRELT